MDALLPDADPFNSKVRCGTGVFSVSPPPPLLLSSFPSLSSSPPPLLPSSSLLPHSDWYERDAVMMCEEGSVIAGLLMGLNAIDYNVMMKGEDFDKSVSYIDN